MSTPTDVPAERATEDGADHTRRRLGLVRERRLAVDRVACSGHGVCAQLLAGVTLDEWGYPVVAGDRVVGDDGRAAADTAVKLCPARALYLR
jgi:ferredoxin